MYEETNNKKKALELEELYNKRLEEFRTSQDMVNRLDATIAVNSEKFLELYNSLNPTLIKNYGLELEKDLKDMDEKELQELLDKMQGVFDKIYSQLDKYLRTGEIEHIDNLLSVKEVSDNNDSVKELINDSNNELTNSSSNSLTETENAYNYTVITKSIEQKDSANTIEYDNLNILRQE